MKVQEELKAYIDGELKPEEAQQVQEQVQASSELAQEVVFLKLLGQEIREMVHEPAVDGATETLAAVAKRRRVSPWRIWGGAFALAASIILIAHLPGMLAQARYADDSTVASTAMQKLAAAPVMAGDKDDDVQGMVNINQPAPSMDKAAAPMAKMTPLTAAGARANGGMSDGGGFPGSGRSATVNGAFGTGTIRLKKAGAGETSYFMSSRQPGKSSPAPMPQAELKEGTGFYMDPVHQQGPTLRTPPDNAKLLQRAPAQPARMVIQNGTLDLYVANVTESQNRAINLAKGVGGFVANSSFSGGTADSEDDTPSAQIELRVPVMQFTNVMARLRGFALTPKDIKTDQVSGNDVTAQYADDEGRLRELHAEENDYVEMLKKVRHMDDILSLKDRLSSVRQDISGYESQVATLKDQSAMSTIDLTLEMKPKPKAPTPKPKVKGWAESTWDSAEATRSDAFKTIAGLGIFLVAWSPIWLPIGIGAWWITRKTR